MFLQLNAVVLLSINASTFFNLYRLQVGTQEVTKMPQLVEHQFDWFNKHWVLNVL